MEQITTVGIDLAKRVFSLHGVDIAGRVVLRKTVRREQIMEVVAKLPPCRIGSSWTKSRFVNRHCARDDVMLQADHESPVTPHHVTLHHVTRYQ